MLVRKNLKPLELCHSINFIRIKMYWFNYLRRCRSSEWSSIEYFRWKIISFVCLAIYNKLNIYEHEHVRGYTVCLNDFKWYKNCTLLPFFYWCIRSTRVYQKQSQIQAFIMSLKRSILLTIICHSVNDISYFSARIFCCSLVSIFSEIVQ